MVQIIPPELQEQVVQVAVVQEEIILVLHRVQTAL